MVADIGQINLGKAIFTYWDMDANNFRNSVSILESEVLKMPNKHFCQGTNCHTNPTSDRFLKSKGIIRGRYAYAEIDGKSRYGYYGSESDRYFC